MTLSIQRSDRRDRRLCRFGVMLVVCSLVINMVAVPKAKAVVTETAALGAAATVCVVDYSTAMMVFSGMKTGAATSSVIGLMDTYAAATGVAASGTALASTIATGILVAGGTLLVGAAAAALIAGFIDWLQSEQLSDGGSHVITSGYHASGPDGAVSSLSYFYSFDNCTFGDLFPLSSVTTSSTPVVTFPDGSYVAVRKDSKMIYAEYFVNSILEANASTWLSVLDNNQYTKFSISYYVDGENTFLSIFFLTNSNDFKGNKPMKICNIAQYSGAVVPLAEATLQPNAEFVEIPNEVPEGLVLSIDTGLSTLPQGDPQAAADVIMQSAIAGSLAPSVNVAPDPSVQPDPDPEPDPNPDPDPEVPTDAPELPSNIGRLGKALTTRFPFSIPWDIAKAVKLLAAPAQAPYWEIDFMRPIAYRFGGLGDTTITIDLGKPEYEIIGITTRLTSTIGFCLALAAATKRFIWMA